MYYPFISRLQMIAAESADHVDRSGVAASMAEITLDDLPVSVL